MRWKNKGAALITMALYAVGYGSATPTAQEDVMSPGGALVEMQVANARLTALRTVEVYQQPERLALLPMFWKDPERAGQIHEGEEVRILAVKETSLWWDRLVWLEMEQVDQDESVWFRIGPEESASRALWSDWTISPNDN